MNMILSPSPDENKQHWRYWFSQEEPHKTSVTPYSDLNSAFCSIATANVILILYWHTLFDSRH